MAQFGLLVRLTLKPGRAAAFDAMMRETIAGVAAHLPRTLAYAVHEPEGEPDVRIFYELCATEDAWTSTRRSQRRGGSWTAWTSTRRAWRSSDCTW